MDHCVEGAKEPEKDDPEEKHDDKANDDAAITYEDIAHECPNLKLSTLLVAEKAFIETDVDHSGEIDVQGNEFLFLFLFLSRSFSLFLALF